MKSIFFKSGVVLCFVVLLAETINAQLRPSRPSLSKQQQNNSSNTPATFGNLPIIIDSSALKDTVLKSIKPPGSFGIKGTNDRIPLAYENLLWDDALYVQKVWRELDLREKMNQTFRYDAVGDNGSQIFINMLLKAVKTGQVPAFEDDRFSVSLTAAQVTEKAQGRLDTFIRYNASTFAPDALVVTRAAFDPKIVTRLRLIEEWIFDREGSRLHCRIIGIAPLKKHYLPDGKEREGFSVMFWVSYSDLRPLLAKSEVYNAKNMGQARMTWEELFESRMFSSYIIKSTLDNVSNKSIRQYIKDPRLALLEGDNIREKIFNYEQDLWAY